MTTSLFAHDQVPLETLRTRAYNFRWAETDADIIPLTAADPDFAVAKEIRQAIADYAQSGVFSYGPHQGLPEFKNELANALALRKDYRLNPELILPIDSAASGMYATARFCLEPGDEAIIFDPVDFLFEQSVLAAGGKVIRCPYDKDTGRFKLELLPELVSDKTRLIGVCNPHNPLGKIIPLEDLKTIAEFANQHQLWIMNDEIWSDIIYPEKQFTSFHHLAPELCERVITVYGFSKAFGLAGLRVGAVISPNADVHQKIVDAAYVMTTAGGVSTISQVAATTALKSCWYWVDAFIEHLTALRDHAVKRLNAIEGVSCQAPEATYLLFADISATGLEAEELVEHLRNYKVAVVPGNERFFGPGAKGHIRICFATSMDILDQGLDRIEAGINALRQEK
ncbi:MULTISPECIES: pyridoxal phosphate-dependent aminotransferase [unclassified Pseudoalteromonas]|uniref:pyridoxal phosphate-dependent aminotransferase n=1 Tax=unclassified Pseudoalteromonas TaxID=194690 RepID=UPI000CF607E8|nr:MULTISPECIES: pyridoxal phosphate-dependent aminotransferase [unclassified Pseudoalteromonas]MBS3798951.1 pyridoxal phosphate-dependent aminotransferase [Pseudoalteromonas sp. BDTF-M6]